MSNVKNINNKGEKSMQLDTLLEQLKEYDIITFDVFDTLITRCVLRPTDVFVLVEEKWNHNRTVKLNFAEIRAKAEQDAYQEYGVCANLEQIYSTLIRDYGIAVEEAMQLKQLELQMELDVAIPRRDILVLFTKLYDMGKKIILCSDMYLSTATITQLLNKTGYPHDIELWVSCERGVSKNDGTLWQTFFDTYKAFKTIHIGDNEWSDNKQVKQYKRDAVVIENPYSAFQKSDMYHYLVEYENKEAANVLVLGYLVNQACFNSPFDVEPDFHDALAVWMGSAFGCFMDWLSREQDDSLLLFVTREGYILQPMYEAYCEASGRNVQENTIFYASRTAATSASALDKEMLKEIMQIEYNGTIGAFTESRLNYFLPEDCSFADDMITLPKQKEQLLRKLEDQYERIFENANRQNQAYKKYVNNLRVDKSKQPLTIVDIGYSGTSQYYLSKVLDEKINGRYLYLNRNPLPEKDACKCTSLAYTADGCHPIFENLLYLEAAMQVPYGQLKQMQLNVDGMVEPICKQDGQTSEMIKDAQGAFLDFVVWMGKWQNCLGDQLIYDFGLAETIWICMLQFSYLPHIFLDDLWLSDDFAGNPKWEYDKKIKSWVSEHQSIPLKTYYQKNKTKYRLKYFVKRNIPTPFYKFARSIWIKFVK